MSAKKIKRKRRPTKRTPTPVTKLKGIIKAKNILDKEVNLNNPIIKALFSISIIGSAIPSVYLDFTQGHSGHFSHYGMILVGILYGIESTLWTLDVWKKK
jgi:hypothetical protein